MANQPLLRNGPWKLLGEITQNNGHTPFKVTDFGTNEKPIYDFTSY